MIGKLFPLGLIALFLQMPVLADALAQDKVAELNARFREDLQKRTETPQWKKLEQSVSVALGLSNLAASNAGQGVKQRVLNIQLETPRETAKYLGDLAFNSSNKTESATAILVEITTNPTAVAQARQLVPPEARAQVNALLDSPQLRKLSSSSLHIAVPAPGAQQPAPAPARPAPASAAPAGNGSSPRPPPPPASGAAASAPQPQRVAAAGSPGAAPAPRARPAVPTGYAPVSGGSMGCRVGK